ncbi:Glutathione transferase omega-1, putative [Perkinsus marinus ATCC 50983]|uniref:Glutathione transferase omega-1, putative n=1 Tax=Perkinsus marinus (strain ATCC 50983 / TXsc) TaxID=423536 RepID=C5KH38_PERM5|nr:Glutathione transferase omega-1, putative [Perkinsus marinus ATCC 50983]EER15900.1 Glutathione transferase omega-1, putative [Perkinsus marinus ATCC 50983]|eukprot:XP_002784104.1 Glutathione transferase omega-1, putative [Perkinsus marinus ATCC 50983]
MAMTEKQGFPRLRFFTSDYCPFAQRARIALEWFKIPFELIEAITFSEGGSEYDKHPLLLEKNPKGLIPTLLVNWPDGREEVVTESLVVVEYIDNLAAKFGFPGEPLLPRDDPTERQRLLERATFYNKNITSPFYAVLMRGDKAEFDKMVAGAEKFISEMRGPFFNGSAISIVDIAAYPWILRSFLLGYYRGPAFTFDRSSLPQLAKLFEWYDRMSAVDVVKATIMADHYYIKAYKKYVSE